LDKLLESGANAKTRENVRIYISPGIIFRSTDQQRADVNHLYFYVYGLLEPLVYSAPTEMEICFTNAFLCCQTIRNRPGTVGGVQQSMITRVHACTDAGTEHFKHLL